MNKTQCPHCFTTYVISDEQLRVSRGIVRCGTCKERFEATLIEPPKVQVFDPRNVFIEPISEQQDETNAQIADIIENAEPVDFKLDNFEEDNKLDSSASTPENVFEDLGIEGLGSANNYEFSEEIANYFEVPDNDLIDETSETADFGFESDSQRPGDYERLHANDDGLIEEVNQLIEKKIIQPTESNKTYDRVDGDLGAMEDLDHRLTNEVSVVPSLSDANSNRNSDSRSAIDQDNKSDTVEPEFSLSSTTKRPISRWFYASFLLILVSSFSATLVYQLWLRQAISWPDDKRLSKVITPIITPSKAPIEKNLDRFNIVIPERRNLSKLELVSARTAPHPTRSSTILLRISLINGAKITQPLPWLELSLNDSEGKLISRRSLSPSDYSYNNRIDEKIGARELKKVTIELLKFPEQATGYELKLLNK